MPGWLSAFVVIAAAAIVIQMAILLALYMQVRQTMRQMTRIATDLQLRIDPILVKLNRILEESQDRISSIVTDASEITRLARNQAQKFDRLLSEAVERLRVQVIRADQILTGALEVIEDAGSKVRRTLLGPVRQASALLQGLKVGLDFIRGGRRRTDAHPQTEDEELFI